MNSYDLFCHSSVTSNNFNKTLAAWVKRTIFQIIKQADLYEKVAQWTM